MARDFLARSEPDDISPISYSSTSRPSITTEARQAKLQVEDLNVEDGDRNWLFILNCMSIHPLLSTSAQRSLAKHPLLCISVQRGPAKHDEKQGHFKKSLS